MQIRFQSEPAAKRSDDCQCIDCDCDPCRCDKELTLKNFAPLAVDDRTSSELERLEGRVTELERTAIDVGQAEEIAKRISTKVAEDVIERYVTKLQLGIRSSGGEVRSETVRFTDPSRSQSFQLAPGESLYSYTDLHTGQVVRIGAPRQQVAIQTGSAPVHSWVTPIAELRMQEAPIAVPRRVYVRPVVEQIPIGDGPIRRSVIGGRVIGGWPIDRSDSCRIVNGQRVCD